MCICSTSALSCIWACMQVWFANVRHGCSHMHMDACICLSVLWPWMCNNVAITQIKFYSHIFHQILMCHSIGRLCLDSLPVWLYSLDFFLDCFKVKCRINMVHLSICQLVFDVQWYTPFSCIVCLFDVFFHNELGNCNLVVLFTELAKLTSFFIFDLILVEFGYVWRGCNHGFQSHKTHKLHPTKRYDMGAFPYRLAPVS